MSYILSPNMSLVIPDVGTELGPQYASDVNSSLTIIDGHTHTAGSGVQITPSAIDINADLPMNDNSLTSTLSIAFTPQSSAPSNDSVYVSGVDLYFVDGNGNNVKITSGGAVNATASGISSGTATASFVGGVLVVDSNVNTPANIQCASILMGNNVANSKYLTLAPPNSMGANYSIVLPSLPAQTNVMTLDTSGNMGSITYDQVGENMTATGANAIAATMTSTGADDIGQTMSSVGADAVANSRTRAAAAVTGGLGSVVYSNTSGTFTTSNSGQTFISGLQVTITTNGRPVMVTLQDDHSGNAGYISQLGNSGVTSTIWFGNGATNISKQALELLNGATVPPSSFNTIDFSVAGAPGTYTYSAYASVATSGSATLTVANTRLVVYEL